MDIRKRKLTRLQGEVLAALKTHGRWDRTGGIMWVWDSPSGTIRHLDALVRKGRATCQDGVYRPVKDLEDQGHDEA